MTIHWYIKNEHNPTIWKTYVKEYDDWISGCTYADQLIGSNLVGEDIMGKITEQQIQSLSNYLVSSDLLQAAYQECVNTLNINFSYAAGIYSSNIKTLDLNNRENVEHKYKVVVTELKTGKTEAMINEISCLLNKDMRDELDKALSDNMNMLYGNNPIIPIKSKESNMQNSSINSKTGNAVPVTLGNGIMLQDGILTVTDPVLTSISVADVANKAAEMANKAAIAVTNPPLMHYIGVFNKIPLYDCWKKGDYCHVNNDMWCNNGSAWVKVFTEKSNNGLCATPPEAPNSNPWTKTKDKQPPKDGEAFDIWDIYNCRQIGIFWSNRQQAYCKIVRLGELVPMDVSDIVAWMPSPVPFSED